MRNLSFTRKYLTWALFFKKKALDEKTLASIDETHYK
jgi:hypothetical protein